MISSSRRVIETGLTNWCIDLDQPLDFDLNSTASRSQSLGPLELSFKATDTPCRQWRLDLARLASAEYELSPSRTR
jgi:hypothetical protein